MLVPVSEAAGAHFGKANGVDVSARGRMPGPRQVLRRASRAGGPRGYGRACGWLFRRLRQPRCFRVSPLLEGPAGWLGSPQLGRCLS